MATLFEDNNDANLDELEKQIVQGSNYSNVKVPDAAQMFTNTMKNMESDNFPESAPSIVQTTIDPPEDDDGTENFHSPYDHDDNDLDRITKEQVTQEKIANVCGNLEPTDMHEFEQVGEDEDKDILIDKIDMLRNLLEDDGVEIENVPLVDKETSFKQIKAVHKTLLLKNDRNRCCTLAEELALSCAYGFEYAFDGKKEWFGRKPDLVGWPNTVKVKLKRMRYETSTFVHEIMSDYKISGGWRLLFEIVPSMLLYSRRRKVTRDDQLTNDSDFRDALGKLNSV